MKRTELDICTCTRMRNTAELSCQKGKYQTAAFQLTPYASVYINLLNSHR